jgi:hypothetical protein
MRAARRARARAAAPLARLRGARGGTAPATGAALAGRMMRARNDSLVDRQAGSPTRCAGRIIPPGLSLL